MTAILNPAIKHYEWGDIVALPDLLGLPRDNQPWAELWHTSRRAINFKNRQRCRAVKKYHW